MKTEIEFIPYGEISSRLSKDRWPIVSERARISTAWQSAKHIPRRVFLAFSQDLDESFVELFRKIATQDTRLLILNEGISTDRLMSRIVDLQIRTPQRFYVIDATVGSGKTHVMAFVHSLLNRLTSAQEAEDKQDRILDARIDDGILHVVSSNFHRVDVPIDRIREFKNQQHAKVAEFEIDEEGSFIYWPELDVHLGWSQLHQLVNPEAALKASQKSEEFNKRYGRAVQKLREQKGLKPSDITGLSEKQLRRIENGECRLTSNAIEILAKAHKLAPNEYMKKLADLLN
jgi:hypothetical protein